ncbi:ParA family protein [Candidatus Atribacteria bacterium MT.SAG.1]|nr:ParA family protein [Candidatus Atribacteria bacterium MT.SAG.1]
MNTIAIINQKGGVGKTTTAINLSSGLAYKEKKTLLIDMDPQSHSTIGLGIEIENQNFSISKILSNPKVLLKKIISKTYIKNLDIVPSHISLARIAEQMYTKLYKEAALNKAIQPIKEDYNYIIIDCPPNLGVLTINALFASDLLIVPCQISRYSLDGLSDLMDVVRAVKYTWSEGDKKISYFKILLTMFDVRNKITNKFILKELKPFKNRIFKTRIIKNEALNQAQIAQKSIFDFAPKSRGAENYKELTKEILNYE